MDFSEVAKNILAVLAALGIGTGILAGAAFWLFKQFGDKWLNAKFGERLEDYKHAQQRELEKLRFSINALMDRTTKLHQHEFEVLPEVWSRLTDAFTLIGDFVSPLQSYANLDRMEDAQLAEFLENSELPNWQKDELRKLPKKNDRYFDMLFWQKLNLASVSYHSFHQYLTKNGIFIEAELKKKLNLLSDILYDGLVEQRNEKEHPNPRANRFEKSERIRSEGRQILLSLEADVQDRLWHAQALE